jgi:DNA polymerase, archaea type
VKLKGRIHIDISNSFVCAESGLDGFFELSRICRMPLHTSSRATIGRALSSLQFYNAHKQDLLVPWKPTLAETPKDRFELLVADRGGFTFEPRLGLYEDVAEYDFSSLYPNIMLKKNISGETVRCGCCPESTNRVPELDWNVCQRRTGIVPKSMEIIVGKRLRYKKLKNDTSRSPQERVRYDSRQVALKWLGVTSFRLPWSR